MIIRRNVLARVLVVDRQGRQIEVGSANLTLFDESAPGPGKVVKNRVVRVKAYVDKREVGGGVLTYADVVRSGVGGKEVREVSGFVVIDRDPSTESDDVRVGTVRIEFIDVYDRDETLYLSATAATMCPRGTINFLGKCADMKMFLLGLATSITLLLILFIIDAAIELARSRRTKQS